METYSLVIVSLIHTSLAWIIHVWYTCTCDPNRLPYRPDDILVPPNELVYRREVHLSRDLTRARGQTQYDWSSVTFPVEQNICIIILPTVHMWFKQDSVRLEWRLLFPDRQSAGRIGCLEWRLTADRNRHGNQSGNQSTNVFMRHAHKFHIGTFQLCPYFVHKLHVGIFEPFTYYRKKTSHKVTLAINLTTTTQDWIRTQWQTVSFSAVGRTLAVLGEDRICPWWLRLQASRHVSTLR